MRRSGLFLHRSVLLDPTYVRIAYYTFPQKNQYTPVQLLSGRATGTSGPALRSEAVCAPHLLWPPLRSEAVCTPHILWPPLRSNVVGAPHLLGPTHDGCTYSIRLGVPSDKEGIRRVLDEVVDCLDLKERTYSKYLKYLKMNHSPDMGLFRLWVGTPIDDPTTILGFTCIFAIYIRDPPLIGSYRPHMDRLYSLQAGMETAVGKPYRGQNLGQKLRQTAIGFARHVEPYKPLYSLVDKSNQAMLHINRKFGFIPFRNPPTEILPATLSSQMICFVLHP